MLIDNLSSLPFSDDVFVFGRPFQFADCWRIHADGGAAMRVEVRIKNLHFRSDHVWVDGVLCQENTVLVFGGTEVVTIRTVHSKRFAGDIEVSYR